MRWSIVITTAPRAVPTLLDTLRSMRLAGGFEHDVSISIVDDAADSATKLGPWRNWRRGLSSLAETIADLYVIMQDDVQVRPGLRKYLEKTITANGVYSPYTSGKDHQLRGELFGGSWYYNGTGWSHCGALMYVMPPAAVAYLERRLPQTVPHNRHIDAHVGELLKSNRHMPLLMHVPSIAQHTGDGNSTMGYGVSAWLRTGKGFVNEPLIPIETARASS